MPNHRSSGSSPLSEEQVRLSRRNLLRIGSAGVAVTASGLLVSCTSGSPSDESSPALGPPKKGGTLTVGMLSGGSTETLDPWSGFAPNDIARMINLYDTLFEYDEELNVHPSLAESGTASDDKSEWTIRLRKGVTFHDGSPLNADAVLFNLRAWTDPVVLVHQQVGYQVDPSRLSKVDDLTVKVGLKSPNARFDQDLAFFWASIKSPNETREPIGTGPFRYVSFTPGSRSEFAAFADHWRDDPAYVERLVFDTSFTDDNARSNALRSGQVDVLPGVAFGLAKTFDGGGTKLLRSQSGAFQNFYMRVDAKPFDDLDVRQALRMCVDRQTLVDVVYNGYGSVSNDVPGKFTRYYDETLSREQDIDQAKFLLKKAGHQDLRITLQTSTAVDGLTQAATLFKEQAKAAGISVDLQSVDPASYFDTSTHYGKMPFAQTLYIPVPSLDFVWVSFLTDGPSNETHWYSSPSYERTQSLVLEAKATDDESKLAELWAELQSQQFNEGGYLNWGTYDYLDAVSDKVQGLTPSKYLTASGYNFRKAWISA